MAGLVSGGAGCVTTTHEDPVADPGPARQEVVKTAAGLVAGGGNCVTTTHEL